MAIFLFSYYMFIDILVVGGLVIIKDLNPNIHDLERVAELIYDVDYRTFKHVFKSKEDGVKAIKDRLIHEFKNGLDDNYLFQVFFDNEDINENEIIGMFNGGKGLNHSFFKEILWLFKNLKISQSIPLAIVVFLDSFVLVDVSKDDFYICELAIHESQRGKGRGHEALNYLLNLAKDLKCKRVVLDSDFRNKGAFKLYSSYGFKVFNKKSFGIFHKRGMNNMEYILDD